MPCQVYHHGDVQELEELKNILYSYKSTEKGITLHNILHVQLLYIPVLKELMRSRPLPLHH